MWVMKERGAFNCAPWSTPMELAPHEQKILHIIESNDLIPRDNYDKKSDSVLQHALIPKAFHVIFPQKKIVQLEKKINCS